MWPKNSYIFHDIYHVMRYSTLPLAPKKTSKVKNRLSRMLETMISYHAMPKDLSSYILSHKLMLYNGIIHNSHPGSFHFLPMGLRSLDKLISVIDKEMVDVEAQKIMMPCLTPAKLWKKSGRWQSAGEELFKLKDRHSVEYCLGPTHEEAITSLLLSINNQGISYRHLPVRLYQITQKFRDEVSPKHGLLRGREFLMKDMYTFDVSEDAARLTYDTICEAYCRVFEKLCLDYKKVNGDTGNIGGTLSHEYHILADVGEDTLLICERCNEGSNRELIGTADENTNIVCPKCKEGNLQSQHGIEVGHTFFLGTKYSSVFNANYQNEKKKQNLMVMGCYGLGVSRILAAAVEVLSTNDRLRWPAMLAPYQICIIPQKEGFKSDVTYRLSEELYHKINELPSLENEVVLDDRLKMSIGKRSYEADKLGFPYCVILGKQALEDPPKYELVHMYDQEKRYFCEISEVLQYLSSIQTTVNL